MQYLVNDIERIRMLTLIHISDTHFHRKEADNRLMLDRLTSIQNEEFLSSAEAYLLVTGDIVDDGHEAQYANAARALTLFPAQRCLVAPGNHDCGTCGIMHDPICAQRFDRIIAGPLGYTRPYEPKQPIVRVLTDAKGKQLITIGINACLETLDPLDMSRGEVGQAQIDRLDAILKNPSAAGIPKLVYLHFHPFERGFGVELRDSAPFLACLRGRVDVLCFGHKHESRLWSGPNQYNIPWIVASGALKNDTGRKYFRITLKDNGTLDVTDSLIL